MGAYLVDLRSDTVTTPSPAMRTAMAQAKVGDDWFGYVPTGTMANQIALRLHFRGTGHLVVAESRAHVTTTEVMSAAALSGIAFKAIEGDDRGQITTDQVRRALEPDEPYDVEVVDLVSVENTHGHAGGTVMSIDDLRAIRKVAQEAGLPVH